MAILVYCHNRFIVIRDMVDVELHGRTCRCESFGRGVLVRSTVDEQNVDSFLIDGLLILYLGASCVAWDGRSMRSSAIR